MKIVVESMNNSGGDHLFFEETLTAYYIENITCDGCDTEMKAIAKVENFDGEFGLIKGLCPRSGHIKRIKNLSVESYSSHFSNKWLVRREEEIHKNKHVYNRLNCARFIKPVMDYIAILVLKK